MFNQRMIIGILLIIFGVIVLIYGDRKLNVDEGNIGRFFFPSNKSNFISKLWKWSLGLVSISIGLSLMI
jgi:steroid 5-alpha reductase family enzyme